MIHFPNLQFCTGHRISEMSTIIKKLENKGFVCSIESDNIIRANHPNDKNIDYANLPAWQLRQLLRDK